MRIGYGFDVHRLVEDRELWIGGVKIEHDKGLLGHSDADVAIHALCDALLGAAALRDIGYWSDPLMSGLCTMLHATSHVVTMARNNSFFIVFV